MIRADCPILIIGAKVVGVQWANVVAMPKMMSIAMPNVVSMAGNVVTVCNVEAVANVAMDSLLVFMLTPRLTPTRSSSSGRTTSKWVT